MTLPVALLIASFNEEAFSKEIYCNLFDDDEIKVAELLSCQCKDHKEKFRLVPPNSYCSSERSSSPSSLSDILSSRRSSNASTTSYISSSSSYFSDDFNLKKNLIMNENFERCEETEEKEISDARLGRRLSDLVDLIENVHDYFSVSSISSSSSADNEKKIIYNNRNILDLGANISTGFPLTHPSMETLKKYSKPPKKNKKFYSTITQHRAGKSIRRFYGKDVRK